MPRPRPTLPDDTGEEFTVICIKVLQTSHFVVDILSCQNPDPLTQLNPDLRTAHVGLTLIRLNLALAS